MTDRDYMPPLSHEEALRLRKQLLELQDRLGGAARALAELPQEVQQYAEQLQPGMTMVTPQYDVAIEKTLAGLLLVHCIKCWGHRMEAEIKPPEDALPKYNHQFQRPLRIIKWNTAKAWRLVRASGRAPRPINREWLEVWIGERSNLVRDHMHHVPPEHLRAPLLLDMVYQEAQVEATGAWVSYPFHLLLDGHHRAARALREGWTPEGFFLTPDEHDQVTTVLMDAFDSELVGWRTREEFLEARWVSDGNLTP